MEGELFSGVSAQGMVDRLCELAVERKASDVHAEPLAEGGAHPPEAPWGDGKSGVPQRSPIFVAY